MNPSPAPSAPVIAWLRSAFADRPSWLPQELEWAARDAHIDAQLWLDCPAVREATGLRMEDRELWPGIVRKVWIIDAEGGERHGA